MAQQDARSYIDFTLSNRSRLQQAGFFAYAIGNRQ